MVYGKGTGQIGSWKGYSPNVKLPATTKCNRCGKVKPATGSHFSNNQLEDLKAYIGRNPTRFDEKITEYIVCKMCNGGQVTELECQWCNRTRGIDNFSSTQRSNPDNARCMDCVREITSYDPEGGSENDSLEAYSDPDDTASSFSGLTCNDHTTSSMYNSTYGGGVGIARSTTSSTPAPRRSGPPHRRKFESDSASVTSAGYASSDAGGTTASLPTKANPHIAMKDSKFPGDTISGLRSASSGKFGKPPNPGPKEMQRSSALIDRETGSDNEVTVRSDSDSDEDLPVH